MRALEKDRTRRYGSPQELAADIGRYLADEPVLASPPSAAYRTQKFVRRHRLGVGVALTGVVVLTAFAVTMAVQRAHIARERDRANSEAEASRRVSAFLADTLGDVDPHRVGNTLLEDLRKRIDEAQRNRGIDDAGVATALASFDEVMRGVSATDASLRLLDTEILSRAVGTIDRKLKDDPLISARLRHTIGDTYRRLDLWERGEEQLRLALEVRGRGLGVEHPDTLATMRSLGVLLRDQKSRRGPNEEAESLLLEVFETQRRLLGDDDPETLFTGRELGWLRWGQRRYQEGEALLLDVLAAQRRVLGDDHPDTLRTMTRLGPFYSRRNDYERAEALLRESYEGLRRVLGEGRS